MESAKTKEVVNSEYRIEIKVVSKYHFDWLRDICLENGCKIISEEWRSKYNKHAVYDYEPFCSGGFDIVFTISSYDRDFLKFVEFLYKKRVSIDDKLTFSFDNSPNLQKNMIKTDMYQ